MPAPVIARNGGSLQPYSFLDEPLPAEEALRLPRKSNMKEPAVPRPVTLREGRLDAYTAAALTAATQGASNAAVTPTEPWEGPHGAGDAVNRVHRIDGVLQLLRFYGPEVDNQGVHWMRPGKEPGVDASASVFNNALDKATIWSSTCAGWWPAVEVKTPYDAFGLLVAANYCNDFSRGPEDLCTAGHGDTEKDHRSKLLRELGGFLRQGV